MQSNFIHKDHQSLPPIIKTHIKENLNLISNDKDVRELFNSKPGSSALIIGTGPSLESGYSGIKKLLLSNKILLLLL
jgi:hypothetical protein